MADPYAYRGSGSTRDRRNSVEGIYARWVPIPSSIADQDAEDFLEEVKSKVIEAIDHVRREAEAQRAQAQTNGAIINVARQV